MAASKMYLSQQILEQIDSLEADYFKHFLIAYFPDQVSKNYQNDVLNHPLAREIKATYACNKIINQAGCLFLQLCLDNKTQLVANCLCYLTFDQVLAADSLRQEIFDLDNKIESEQQYIVLQVIEKILLGFCRWALVNGRKIVPSAETIKCYSDYIQEYQGVFQQELKNPDNCSKRIDHYQHVGFTQALAERISFIEGLENFPFLVTLSIETARGFTDIIQMLRESDTFLGLDMVYNNLSKIQFHDSWEEKVCLELQNSIKQISGQLVKAMIKAEVCCSDFFYDNTRKQELQQYQAIYHKINALSTPDIMPYIVLKEALAKLL